MLFKIVSRFSLGIALLGVVACDLSPRSYSYINSLTSADEESQQYLEYVKFAEHERRFLGHDRNQSGVRDDVEQMLNQQDLDQQQFSIGMTYAALLQELMRSNNQGQLIRISHHLQASLQCLHEVLGEQSLPLKLKIERQQFNNEERNERARQQYDLLAENAEPLGTTLRLQRFCQAMQTRYVAYQIS